MTFTISGLAQLKGSTVIGRNPYALGGFNPKLILDFTTGTYSDGAGSNTLSSITTFSRASSATYMDASGVMQTATSGTVRDAHHEYDGASWNRTLLLETDDATNLCLQFDCSGFNSVANATFTANSGNSPVGASTAGLWTENSASGTHTVRTDIDAVTSTGRHTRSFLMKSNGRDHWVVTAGSSRVAGTSSGNSNWSVAIDLSAGTVVEALGRTECGIEDFGGGWYRVWVAFNALSVGVVPMTFGAREVAGGSSVYTGDGTSGAYFAAMQTTAGDYPFMFIPTSGSTVTRAAETLQINAASMPWSSTGISTVIKCNIDYVDDNSLGGRMIWNWGLSGNDLHLKLSTFEGKTGNPHLWQRAGGTYVRSNYNTVDIYSPGRRVPMKLGSRHIVGETQLIAEGTALVAGTGTTAIPTNSGQPFEPFSQGTIAINGTIDLIEVWDADIGATNLETGTA